MLQYFLPELLGRSQFCCYE